MPTERRLRNIATPRQRIGWILMLATIAVAMLALRDRGAAIAPPGPIVWIAIAVVAVIALVGWLLVRRRRTV